ncbi:MAG: Crp/Fnr family transcriptional regulator [Xanthobacteraceae bacterium]|nr:Crp/Fnr family transcriptional regulator [Xanthobacteraceae bacterium]
MPLDRSLISDLPIFATLDGEALDDILGRARTQLFTRSTSVFTQDEAAHSFFVLLHGRLRVTQVTPEGQQIVMRFVGPGEIFGVAMALRRATYPATATAVVDSLALAWPSAAWAPLVAAYPPLAVNALQTMGARLQEAQTRLREISTEEVERRIAHAVLRLAAESGRETADGLLIDFPLSRQDLAEMTGTTLHTVSRIVSAWEHRGLVEGGRQRIVVRDLRGLKGLVEALPD